MMTANLVVFTKKWDIKRRKESTAFFLPATASKHPERITSRLANRDSAIGCVD
jgi:hypothetical protein